MCSYVTGCYNDGADSAEASCQSPPHAKTGCCTLSKEVLKTTVWDSYSSWGLNHDVIFKNGNRERPEEAAHAQRAEAIFAKLLPFH